jgi:protease-4
MESMLRHKDIEKAALEKFRSLADDRIYTSRQALEYGLIDQIGYLDEAITLAKQEAGLTTARVIIYHRPGAYKNNIYSQLGSSGRGKKGGKGHIVNIK